MGELPAALAGPRVLDLTDGFAGALCTMVLGDNGAAVRRPVSTKADTPADDRLEPPGARQWRRSTEVVPVPPAQFAVGVESLLDDADVAVLSVGSRALQACGLVTDEATAQHDAGRAPDDLVGLRHRRVR